MIVATSRFIEYSLNLDLEMYITNIPNHMKNLVFIFLFHFILSVSGQTIKENIVDEFTETSKISTSWETLNMSMKSNIYQRVRKLDNSLWLNLKISLGGGSVFAVNEGAELFLKLESDSVITLHNQDFTVTSKGGGAHNFMGSAAQGVSLYFKLSKNDLDLLSRIPIAKFRLYLTKSYIEEGIKSKLANKLKKACDLIKNLPLSK